MAHDPRVLALLEPWAKISERLRRYINKANDPELALIHIVLVDILQEQA